MAKRLKTAWQPTIIICTFAYALILHYLVLGIPGAPYPHSLTKHYYWRETAAEVEKFAESVRNKTGKEPIIVGMSKWSIASALSFYTHESTNLDIRSRNLLGDSGAMYDYWLPSQSSTDRPIIQIGMKHTHLDKNHHGDDIRHLLIQPGIIEHRVIERYDVPIRSVYYRVSKGLEEILNF